jgi:hypothetical protein
MSVTYSVFVFGEFATLSLWPVRLYKFFHIISQTARFSKNNIVEHKMCVPTFSSTLYGTFFVIRIERDMIREVYRSSHEVLVILVTF